MSHGEAEKPQPPGGEIALPAGNSSLKEAEKEITNALKRAFRVQIDIFGYITDYIAFLRF
jgi:hypothetical protein